MRDLSEAANRIQTRKHEAAASAARNASESEYDLAAYCSAVAAGLSEAEKIVPDMIAAETFNEEASA